jgi:ribonuclease P/MRP protein subunit RPP40
MWFSNYLSGRTQAVQINNVLSDFSPLVTGVPQGSVLGPVLFLIFINDLPSCLMHSSVSLYADDTAFHVSGKTVNEVQTLLQQDINNLVKWFKKNKLTINVKNSFCMVFSCTSSNNI